MKSDPAAADSGFPFRTIIFDLDGTLVDSLGDVAAAVNSVLRRRRLAPIEGEDQKALVGEGTRARIAAAFAMRGVVLADGELNACIEEYEHHYRDHLVATTRPYSGVAGTLRSMHELGLRLAVCTNKEERYARKVLEQLGLMPPIEDVAGGDSFGVRKPDPAHLLKLLKRMNADPQSALMVGDSHHDIHAARNAGLPALQVSWGYGSIEEGQHECAILHAFPDLIRVASELKR